MRSWTAVSAALAPVSLIGGWTLAAARQGPDYDPVRDTISALAADGASDRWVMTLALGVLGVCHLVTAVGLDDARVAGRVLLALGGVATVAVAAIPEPAPGHVPAAAVAFVALAVWPAASGTPGRRRGAVATLVLLVLLAGLGVGLRHGDVLGLTERLLAGAEALWPLAAVLGLVRRRGPGARSASRPR